MFHYIFPQVTMGLALLIVILKTIALRTGDEHYNRAARFWAKLFGIFKVGGRSDWPDAGHGRHVFVFSRIEFTRAVSLRREAPGARGPLVFCGDGFRGRVAVGIFHRGNGRVDAASRRLFARRERCIRIEKFLGLAREPVDAVAIPAHDDRRGANGLLRDGGHWRILYSLAEARRLRPDVRARGRDCGSNRRDPATLSDGRWAWCDDRPLLACHSCSDGRIVPHGTRSAADDSRAAGRSESAAG